MGLGGGSVAFDTCSELKIPSEIAEGSQCLMLPPQGRFVAPSSVPSLTHLAIVSVTAKPPII